MKKSILILALVLALTPLSFTSAQTSEIFDTSRLSDGVIGVAYTSKTPSDIIRIAIQKDKHTVLYPYTSGSFDFFPLQYGNGEYKVSVMKQVGKNKYAFVKTITVTLSLKDPLRVYLNSIQNIKFSEKDAPITFFASKTKNKDTQRTLDEAYTFLTENIAYDWDKAKSVKADYIPSILLTYKDKKGICYDYASLFAAFLRSRSIPTKLVKGYSPDVEGYHAWNEVFIDGKWQVLDVTVDSALKPKVRFRDGELYRKVHEY